MAMPWDENVQKQIAMRRGALANALVSQWRTVADRRYHVVRGFVDWSAWDFGRYPDAVAIQLTNVRFQSLQLNTLTAVFEIMNANKYDMSKTQDLTERFADTGLDRIYFDSAWVFQTLCEKVDDNGMSVVQNITYNEIVAEEVHDPDDTIQGVLIRAPITY